MVLATCESGVGGGRSGAQLHGLAGTLLTMGARTIVAAIGALPDTARHATQWSLCTATWCRV